MNAASDGTNKSPSPILWLYVFFRAHNVPLEVFLRKPGSVGRAYFGYAGLMSIFWMAVFTIYTSHTNSEARAMEIFFFAFLASAFYHAVTGALTRPRHLHSSYMGNSVIGVVWPWLLQKRGELWIKKYAEPAMLLILGLVMVHISTPIGSYLLFGVFTLRGAILLIERRDRLRTEAMNDAVIEQRYLHEMYKPYMEDR
ncbi:hypothetical protein [Zavarzinella formosa]|uniref:hypothetical protein n=1 Tax=Zavarzinella formosa TaxID=360055 RepID=UPI000360A8BB|nr:hypothetical protein [Zavarzinella formosa]